MKTNRQIVAVKIVISKQTRTKENTGIRVQGPGRTTVKNKNWPTRKLLKI